MKLVIGRDDLATAALSALPPDTGRVIVKPVHNASRGFVNDAAADICEVAVVTLLQAVAYDRPVLLLPITALGRHQHQTLVTLGEQLTAGDIKGHTAGVRSWSQTTGVWVRGFLAEQYGVDLRRIDWITYEDGHLPEYSDPDWVKRAPEGSKLSADLLAGRVNYGVMGNELPSDDRIRTAIPEALEVAARWAAVKGFAPVNHVLAMTADAAAENTGAILAAYDAMAAVTASEPLHPAGFGQLRGPVSQVAAYAWDQGLLPRAVDFDELVERTCGALHVSPARLGG
jgi:4,5-dihydroxyphthalate decarboxylase